MDFLPRQLKSALFAEGGGQFTFFLSQYAAQKSKESRKQLVLEHFHLQSQTSSHPGEYERGEVMAELIADSLSHGLVKGLTYAEIHRFLCLFAECMDLLLPTKPDGELPTLPTAVKHFKTLVQSYSSKLSHTSLLTSVNYISETLLQHYHLYQYTLLEDQPLDRTVANLSIETIEIPQPLSGGVTEAEWERREGIEKLEAACAAEKKEFLEAQAFALKEESARLEEVYKAQLSKLQEASEMTEQEVSEVIDSLARAHVESARSAILQEMKEYELDVGFQVQKLTEFAPRGAVSTPQPTTPSKAASPAKDGKQSRATSRRSQKS